MKRIILLAALAVSVLLFTAGYKPTLGDGGGEFVPYSGGMVRSPGNMGSAPGPVNGYDFVMTIEMDNGHDPIAWDIATFVADSLGGTVDIAMSKIYADSLASAVPDSYLTTTQLNTLIAAGHGVAPQGIYKPYASGGLGIAAGIKWNRGYASFTDADSLAADLDRAWMATLLTQPESAFRMGSWPYGYSNGLGYKTMQAEGYSYGRTFRTDADYTMEWPTGFADRPFFPKIDMGDSVFNIYYMGGNRSIVSIMAASSYAACADSVEKYLVQPAIADSTYYMSAVFHKAPYNDNWKWMLNYLNDNYRVWFVDHATYMDWWAPQNALYPRRPPADARGSILAGVAVEDSVWWGKYPEPTATRGYVFHNSTTATLITTGGLSYTAVTGVGFAAAAIDPAAPTASSVGNEIKFRTCALPINGTDETALLYFACADSLAGKKINKATLYWFVSFWPGATTITYGPGEANPGGRRYLDVISVTNPNVAIWAATGTVSGNTSYNEYDVTGSSAWSPGLDTYTDRADIGIESSQWGSWGVVNNAVPYSVDVTHGVQAWADGAVEGGFMFTGESSSAGFFTVYSHGGPTSRRPFLVVDVE